MKIEALSKEIYTTHFRQVTKDKWVTNALVSILKQRIDELLSHPDMDVDNDILVADMLEGETNLHDIVSQLVGERQIALADAKAARDAKKALIERMDARIAHAEKRSETCDRMLLDIFQHVPHAERFRTGYGTVSVRQGSISLHLDDDFTPPQGYARVKIEPEKMAIRKALENGETIPGAELRQGPQTISVR